MDALVVVIAALTAFAAGVTGAWSPCGFSMVDTLGSAIPRRGRRTVAVASATFAAGALVGGVLTFGLLSALGGLLHAGDSTLAVGAAVVVAGAAAVADAMGWRIAPQIRRQVPERWRRTMPLPVAAGLYGVLLGLGFTTFVLTFAVWALAGVSIALGSLAVGLAVGLGFGLGRAVPVVVMVARHRTVGGRLIEAMEGRPRLLGGLRRVDATLLGLLAVAMVAGPASAAPVPYMGAAIDPSVDASTVAVRTADGAVLVRDAAGERRVAGATAAAPAGPWLVTESAGPDGRGVAVDILADLPGGLDRSGPVPSPAPLAWRAVRGVTAVGASPSWAVWRRRVAGGREVLEAARLPALTDVRTVAVVAESGHLSRPSVDGDVLVYAENTPRRSRIVSVDLATGARAVLRASITLVQFRDPSLSGDRLLFVRAGYCDQRLRLEPVRGAAGGRVLMRIGSTALRDPGYTPGRTTIGTRGSRCPEGSPARTRQELDATALSPTDAYVSVWRPGTRGSMASSRVLRAPLAD